MTQELVDAPAAPLDASRLDEALRAANVPTLLAVLVQLTGDRSWLAPRYRPTRPRGMDDNRTGGLPEVVQDDVRAAVAAALRAHWAGRPVALPDPSDEQVMELLDFTAGEEVPAEFAPMMAEIVRGTPRPAVDPLPPGHGLRAIVVGAGIGGMLASVRLAEAGVEHVVLEKNDGVGGSWYENRYPGAGVDTPSYLYSYSFFDHDWSTHFGKRDEVQSYLDSFADAHGLRERVRFGVEVEAADWDEEAHGWRVTARAADGTREVLEAPVLISAVGLLNRPKVPALPGLESFRGPIFHTARWPEDLSVADLAGKRVAIVGTGASAMQVGPAIVDTVGSLTVFQRSPQWVAPNDVYFEPVGDDVHWLNTHVPGYRHWYRARLSWIFNDKVHPTLQVDPDWPEERASINAANHGHRRFYERYLRDQLGDREDLVAKALPDYPPFGKRMLLDNGWFAMLRREHVDLVTERVEAVTQTGLVDGAGVEREFDVVVLATGFHADRLLHPMQVRGRSGASTVETWGEHDARAYLGITVPDFPNLFVMTGPNTALGHGGSFITMLECQVRYVLSALAAMVEQDAAALECRQDVCDEYNRRVDEAHAQMVWTHPAMDNWYRNADGRVVSVLPWRIIDYWTLTRQIDLADYLLDPRDRGAGPA
ncbi:NAD(P)/FAD-dependent oxidoreductase [Nocardioides sp. GY 10127]|uniref:flavin-containing monooxygenase n=1 Tax=Nocardioides sp. GY 10127 TaxID=2569762 RepID=UPI0010A78453|nr:NAD(P)/FAD-dependent oxidoreductase [Nocardioides sp. GY 10127]TIC84164.1 NAD(P)/FAD-dependent oxidoreductase [Nocardioides sp. GY 10127]